jgi:hypothetical protein
VTVEVTRGLEYRVETRAVNVAAGAEAKVQVPLVLLDDLEARGWVSGDLHVHMNYGGAYRMTPESDRAADQPAHDLLPRWRSFPRPGHAAAGRLHLGAQATSYRSSACPQEREPVRVAVDLAARR